MKAPIREIKDYDNTDTTGFIDPSKAKTLADIGFRLPKEAPTKVVSIRLPTQLFNQIKAYSTNIDMPFQAYIKYVLSKGIAKDLKSHRAKTA